MTKGLPNENAARCKARVTLRESKVETPPGSNVYVHACFTMPPGLTMVGEWAFYRSSRLVSLSGLA